MKRIRYLTVRFDAHIDRHELTAFRGAIIQKVGREVDQFHNHAGETGFLYRYPAIQYKRIGQSPAIVCLEEGVDAIHALFGQPAWDIHLNDRPLTLRVADLRLHQYTLQAWEHTFAYTLTDWLALNSENYARFQSLSSDDDRFDLLERILRGNILSMAKGLGWHIDREVRVRIRDSGPLRWLHFKDQLLAGFTIEFSTNVFLPDYIGLGKGVSIGFGVVKAKRDKRQRTNDIQSENDEQQ